MSEYPQVLVATLGGQPQIVTFTLDLLLQAGYPITEVIVLHPRATESSRLRTSLSRLSAEFAGNIYPAAQRAIHFQSCALELDGRPIDDIIDDAHADGTLNTIQGLIGELKRKGCRIHLSVTGGRRLMGLLAVSVAGLTFDRNDHIWHIYTPDELTEYVKANRLMHVAPDVGIKLIKGPFIALGAYIAHPVQTFRSLEEEQRLHLEAEERAHCSMVMSEATTAQLKVLRAFARGLRPQQVAEDLSITLVTVNTHKTALLGLCHNAWGIPDKERLDYHFLRAKFAGYFQGDA